MSKTIKAQVTEDTSVTDQIDPNVKSKYDLGVLSGLTTKAAQIRYLDSRGLTRGQISKVLKIRYQWVRNVLITPVGKKQS